jgi:hypothetical protein
LPSSNPIRGSRRNFTQKGLDLPDTNTNFDRESLREEKTNILDGSTESKVDV